MKRALLLLACCGLLLPVSCSYFGRDIEPYRPSVAHGEAVPSSGRDLYLKDCAWCHGDRGEGTAKGPDLLTGTNGPANTDFMLTTGRMPIGDPGDRVERVEGSYTEEEVAAIVNYTRTFGAPGPDIPHVDPSDEELPHGQVLYQENCAACHSTTGIGGALTSSGSASRAPWAPEVTSSTALQVAEAIRIGPGTMPVFGPETLDDEELNAIVGYVEYLKDPRDAGGADLGRVGPVAEGAVGWLVGLGLLLLLVRWMGTKVGDP